MQFKTIKAVWGVMEVAEEYCGGYIVSGTRVTSSREVAQLFTFLKDETKEYFYSVHLDTKNKIIAIDTVSIGSLNASIVHPREVFKAALLSSAAAVIFVHNHPSGDCTPSREDMELTSRLKAAGELLGIKVHDHIIVTERNYKSFADCGLL